MKEQVGVALQPQEVPDQAFSLVSAEDTTTQDLAPRLPEGFEVPRDKRGRIGWALLRDEPEKLRKIIETECQKFLDLGYGLTQQGLQSNGRSGLAAAISMYYPGGMLGLKDSLTVSVDRKPPNFWTDEKVEGEAVAFIQENGSLTYRLLKKKKRGDLIGGIARYPGKIIGLKQELGIDLAQQPSGYWQDLDTIEREVRDFLVMAGTLSQTSLIANNRYSLNHAIKKYYPGGIRSLREKLGVKGKGTKPLGFWTEKRTEEEALRFFQQEGSLTARLIKSRRRGDLEGAINKYPGKMIGLKQKLGIGLMRRPRGFWNEIALIEQEAEEFFNNHGGLSQSLLKKSGRGDLAFAINNYPGGMYSLKIRLGIEPQQKPAGYWSDERVEQEALNFLHSEGGLTYLLMAKKGRYDLQGAVGKYGMRRLKLKLGIKLSEKPKGYWTPENTEKEAQEFYTKVGLLTQATLKKNKRTDLLRAIRGYPGGMEALKEKLGIIEKDPAVQLLEDYEAVLQSGEAISFDEFVRRENNAGV